MLTSLFDRIAGIIIERSWFRSDRIWTATFVYRTWLVRIPFYMDRWALSRSQYWHRRQLDALAERRLTKLFREVAHIPLWHAQFERSFVQSLSARESLARFPVISRLTFKDLKDEEYLSKRHLTGSKKNSTSGSTGVPFSYVHDRGTFLAIRAMRDRDFSNAASGRYPLVLLRADRSIQERFHKPLFVYLRGLADIPERFGALAECITKNAPDGAVLYTFPSMAIALAQHMESHQKELRVRAIIGSGESVSADDRKLLERVFKAPYRLLYSSLEISGIAFECEHGQMHVNEEDMCVEIVDGDGRHVPEGVEGRIVVTMYGYRVMPFIRYFNGDIGTLSSNPCGCGRSSRVIALVGRTPTMIEQKDGYTVTLTELSTRLNFFPRSIRAYQIIHEAPDRISIHIVPGDLYVKNQKKIEQRVMQRLHPDTTVTFVSVDEIPPSQSGKARYYVKNY